MSRRWDDPGVRGWLAVDKPPGPTSHDVVARVRRALDLRRVGHAGTLDPFASGLLLCLAGNATRLVRWLHGWPKTYVGTIVLGAESPTDDVEGLPGPTPDPVPLPPAPVLAAAARRLTGEILQRPPAYSAKKVGGERAHHLARRGYTPELAPVPVTVHRLRLCPARRPGRIHFAARVSAGTYLRALARDLGRLVGTGGYLESLRRTAIGPVSAREAVRLDALPGQRGSGRSLLRPVEDLPLPFPDVLLDPEALPRFLAGNPVEARDLPPGCAEGNPVRVLDPAGRMLGVGIVGPGGRVHPRTVLPPA